MGEPKRRGAHGAPDHTIVETLWTWLPGGVAQTAAHGAFGAAPLQVDWGYLLDPLSSYAADSAAKRRGVTRTMTGIRSHSETV